MCVPIEDDFEILRRDFCSDSCVRIYPGMNRYESARHYLEMFVGRRPKQTDGISIQAPYNPQSDTHMIRD